MEERRSVLVVDDERNIRVTLREALASAGYEVEVAEDAARALERVEARPWDLILLDLRLPDLDGLEVLTRVRLMRPDARVVVLTAHGTVDSAVTAMKGGATDFVQKPFTPDELRRVVARALGRGPEVPPSYERTIADARTAARRGHLDVAEALARSAFALDPERAEAPCLLGALLELQGQRRRAQDLYRAAVALDATFSPARINLDRGAGQVHETPPLLGDEE